MRLIAPLLGCALALVLGGCQSTDLRGSRQAIGQDLDTSVSALQNARLGNSQAQSGTSVRVVEEGYFGVPAPRALSRDRTLPMTCNIVFKPTVPVDVTTFAQLLSRNPDCRLQVRVTQDALAALNGGFPAAPAPASAGPAAIPALPAFPGLPAAGGSLRAGIGIGSEGARIQEQYSGDVATLLDIVTTKLGLSWRYRDGGVAIFYLDTRFIAAYAIPTSTTMDSTVSSGSTTSMGMSSGSGMGGMSSGLSGGNGGVSGSSTSSQSTTVSLKTDAAADVSKIIQSMLTPDVGRMAPGMGGYVVTDRPEVLDRIQGIIDQHNEYSTLQVLLNFKVISVTLNNSNDFGINWALVWKSISSQFGVNLTGGASSIGEAVSGTVSILEGSPFAGSELIMNALAKQGDVSVVSQPSVSTLNMEPAPVQIGSQTGYIARSQSNQASNVGTSSSLEPGTVTTGFNMNVLPYVLPDKRTILMQFSLNLSALKEIRRYENNDAAIEMPNVDGKIFSNKVRIRSGETLVMSGFEQTSLSSSATGVGNPRFWFLGGGGSTRKSREVLVVLVTPIVQEG